MLLCVRPSHSQPLSSYLTFALSGVTVFSIYLVTIVSLPKFSVAWFKKLKARGEPLHYGGRRDPCGTLQAQPSCMVWSVVLVKGVHFWHHSRVDLPSATMLTSSTLSMILIIVKFLAFQRSHYQNPLSLRQVWMIALKPYCTGVLGWDFCLLDSMPFSIFGLVSYKFLKKKNFKKGA